MRIDIKALLFALRTSFWILPSVIGLACLASGYFIMEADLAFQHKGVGFVPLITMPIESARLALSTIAGSMITIASLVFSMTLVALTLVSQQFGPRILMLFMDDRETQVVLGLFVGTFMFALIILLRLGDEAMGNRVPGVAVIAAAALTILSLGMMIRFIHHISMRIQADVLIAELGADLSTAAQRFADQEKSDEDIASDKEMKQFDAAFDGAKVSELGLANSGYLRRLESHVACELAAEHDLRIKMLARPGQFVLAGTPVLAVAQPNKKPLGDDLRTRLCELVSVGQRRTPEASIEFEISALVEVALRALSPGVNDPFTANACIDRLGDGLGTLMHRKTEQPVSRDEDGQIRVMHAGEHFFRYLNVAFEPIAQAAGDSVVVNQKLKAILTALSKIAEDQAGRPDVKEQCLALLKQVDA